jgi:proliferating cell nuclear antigen
MNEENNILTIKSIQIQPIRNMITAIKDILTDVTMTFTKDGLKIINFDKTCNILVNIFLHADKFEKYVCIPDKIIICANALHLFKVISIMSNNDTLCMYIEKADYHEGIVSHLGFQYDNGDKKKSSVPKLRLIEPDTEELIVPELEYLTVINLLTADFQKIIRDLNLFSDRVEIKSVGNDMIFSCRGGFADLKITLSESDGNMDFIQKPDASVVIQGEFSLISMLHFIKCTPLCTTMEIYLKNDGPLIVKYNVSSLGYIKLGLSSLPPA